MNKIRRRLARGQRGDAKIWIVLIVVIVFIGVYMVIKMKPIYEAKWDFEKYAKEQIRRLYSLGEEGIFELVNERAIKNKMALRPYEDCTFRGEREKEGVMICNYKETITFPGNYKYEYRIRIEARVSRIPVSSY